MRKAVVFGLGVSGQSAAQFLLKRGVEVTGVDQSYQTLQADLTFPVYGEENVPELAQFDALIVSPGVSPNHPLYQCAKRLGLEILGEVELALQRTTLPVIGITGTNGKTTVTLLVAHVLNASGIPAVALGNVGMPITVRVDQCQNQVLVVELSSYQLETLHSRKLDAGIILNVSPDHLDRYPSMEAYVATKIQIKECIKDEGELFVFEETYQNYKTLFGQTLPTLLSRNENVASYLPMGYQRRDHFDEDNMQAAFALCQAMGVTPEQFRIGASSFQKPPHRMEFVKELEGVSYINDSKGTNIDAVIRGVQSVEGKIVLIAGGVEKGASYQPWVAAFANLVRAECLIGEAKEAIHQALKDQYPTHFASNLNDAVEKARTLAHPGDTVLLSPGCSSFDQFSNYEERGNTFKQIVHTLYKEQHP